MDLRSIYTSNGIGIFLLMILYYISRTRILRGRTEDRIYSFMILSVMGGCFMEAFSYTVDGQLFPGARFLNYAANTYLYTFNLLLPFAVLVYTDLGLFGDKSRIWKHYKPQILIGIFMLLLNIPNFFYPITYAISEQNVYSRRPLSYLYYVVILYFCFSAMFLNRRYEKENGARTFFSIELFLVPIIVGSGLQFMFYGLSLAWVSAAIGLTGLYMMLQNETAYIDPLLDVYNRQYLNHFLSAWISQGYSFAGLMMDIDHFKSINDCFGHSEGDRALRTVADLLKQSRIDNERVFRFAGDEFIILKRAASRKALDAYIAEFGRQLDEYNRSGPPYPLSISYGKGYIDDGNIDAFLKEMDERMYEMKAEHHRTTTTNVF